MSVRGPAAVAALCLRCVAVLALVNIPTVLVLQAIDDASAMAEGGALEGFQFLLLVLLVAAVPVALLGFPAGLLTAHLLRRTDREVVHVTVFALVGAVLSVVLCQYLGVVSAAGVPAAVAAAEGAVGAGGARWWSGRARRRRLATPVTVDAAEVGRDGPWGAQG